MASTPTLWNFNPEPESSIITSKNNVEFNTTDKKSIGELSDFAVKKVINTQEGTIEKTPVNDNDIANKKYVDDTASGGGAATLTQDEYTGADCSGSNGEANRTLDIGVTSALVFINTSFYHLGTNYTIADTTVTFLAAMWDESPITICYI